VSWLWISVAISVVLTVVANLVLLLFPGLGTRISDGTAEGADRSAPKPNEDPRRRHVRVIVPWKAMLIGSLILTVAVNVLIRIH
jgi:hypothetical protein